MATVPMAASLGKSSNRAAGTGGPAGGALATPPTSSAPSHGTSRSTSSMNTNPNPNPPSALDERGSFQSQQQQQQQQQARETASSQRQSASSNVTAVAASGADKQSSVLGGSSAGGAVAGAAVEGTAASLNANATAPNTRAASGTTAASATAGSNNASQQKQRDTTNNNNANMSSTTSSVNSPTINSEQTISYSAERIIGNGSFGVVFQAAVVETGEIVAIKKVLQDKRFKNRELQIMRQLVKDPHSNIVGLKHCFYSQVR